ncbi:MAG: galactokinase [Acidimicrobiales bacterium]
MRRVFAPGRVNLIGEHTDYSGGLVLPMAIQLGTTVEFEPGGDIVHLVSADEPLPAVTPIEVADVAADEPAWARLVAAVVAEVGPSVGGQGSVSTTLPIGAGLSSSASLEVAVALALGFEGSALELALLCQRAERRAWGVPCGIMDQLASAAGAAGHALLIDCTTNSAIPVAIPEEADILAVHSGQTRTLAGSAYADRRAACEQAAAIIGPLRDASPADLARIDDPVVRSRARHVVNESARTLAFVEALHGGELESAGRLMTESHASLRDDFEVSTPILDALVDRLAQTSGVLGVRLTGAGFGGCVVVLCERGAVTEGWRLMPSDGANAEEM